MELISINFLRKNKTKEIISFSSNDSCILECINVNNNEI